MTLTKFSEFLLTEAPADIADAIAMVADDLHSHGAHQYKQAIRDAAEEYSLNPVLVDRKFREAHGDPERYLETKSRAVPTETIMRPKAEEAAKKWFKDFHWHGNTEGSQLAEKLVGKEFKNPIKGYEGDSFLYVAVTPKGVAAIKLQSAERYYFSKSVTERIVKQVLAAAGIKHL